MALFYRIFLKFDAFLDCKLTCRLILLPDWPKEALHSASRNRVTGHSAFSISLVLRMQR